EARQCAWRVHQDKTEAPPLPLHPRPSRDTLFSQCLRPEHPRRVPNMQLKLSTRIIDGVTIVDCNGRIVFGEESGLLRDTVKKLLAQTLRVVLNLAGISYIDSGGLGTLVALYTTAQNAGGAVKLANLTQRVGDLLQVTKLVTVFEVYDSEQEAVDSFKQGAAA